MAAPIIDERARAALRRLQWQMRRQRVATTIVGEHRSIFRGRGMEFDQVVPYAYGDDIRDIDWNVTARLGEPYRKTFVEEREVQVLVVLADDPPLQFGSGRRSKRDVALELASLAMMTAVLNGERVGLLHVQPDMVTRHPPSPRRANALGAIARLFAASPPDPAGQRVRDPATILQNARERSLVVWIGETPSESPPAHWMALRRKRQMVGIRVEDPWERSPPGHELTAFDPISQQVVRLADSRAAHEAHARWRSEREARWQAWWPQGGSRLTVGTDADPLSALVRFLHKRGAVA